MKITILQDDKPGHFNQSEGILLSLSRLSDVTVERIRLQRKYLLPQKILRFFLKRQLLSLADLWALAYKNKLSDIITETDLIISAGGDTLLGNIILAKQTGAQNIFAGSIRGFSSQLFSAVIIPYSAYKNYGNYIVSLKPSPIDPDSIDIKEDKNKLVLLLGGPSGDYTYTNEEWETLLTGMQAHATKVSAALHVFTSRRTPHEIKQYLKTLNVLAYDDGTVSTQEVFTHCLSAAQIFVTQDSSSMISEAVVSRRPVISIRPKKHNTSSKDLEYLNELITANLVKSIPITSLNNNEITRALKSIQPMKENHLDALAAQLKAKLLE